MPLATKNGSLIVKSGSIAENCTCKEGACCTGTTCSVRPQCQCQGTGQRFKGVGTTCNSPCQDCFYFIWGTTAPNASQTCDSPAFGGRVKVTIPDRHVIPAGGLKIFISGGFDDKGTVNGEWRDRTKCIEGLMPNEITVTSRDITFEVYDTVGGAVGIAACICVPNDSSTPIHAIVRTRFPNIGGGTLSASGWTIEYPAFDIGYNNHPWRNEITSCGPLSGNPLP